MNDLVGARVVAVHAHPDDESITTGGVLFDLARRGAHVTVVTCTLGEQGEVIGETYQGLVADAADQLGGFRIGELEQAMRELGVYHRFLGFPGCWRDSGMMGDPSNDRRGAFLRSGDTAVQQLREIFDELQPHLILTYGPDGGYGHPDHIRAHEITHAAATGQRILWAVHDTDAQRAGLEDIRSIPEGWRFDELANAKADITVHLDDAAYAAKAAAMRAHATQLWLADGSVSKTNPHSAIAEAPTLVYCLSNLIAQPLMRDEHYQIAEAGPAPVSDRSDVMSGLQW